MQGISRAGRIGLLHNERDFTSSLAAGAYSQPLPVPALRPNPFAHKGNPVISNPVAP